MSLLAELNTLLGNIGIPVETGVFSASPPDEYLVLTPLTDRFALFGDDKPQMEVQEVRISLFRKNNYLMRKNQLEEQLLAADITITDRRYIGHEDDTGFHHYSVDVVKPYFLDESYWE